MDVVIRRFSLAYHHSLELNNPDFFHMLTDGVPVVYQEEDRIAHGYARLVDFDNLENNYFMAVNQFTVIENNNNRRQDVVIFLNNLPIAVIELKNPLDPTADIWSPFRKLQTYKVQIPSQFR